MGFIMEFWWLWISMVWYAVSFTLSLTLSLISGVLRFLLFSSKPASPSPEPDSLKSGSTGFARYLIGLFIIMTGIGLFFSLFFPLPITLTILLSPFFIVSLLLLPYFMLFTYPEQASFWLPIGVITPILLLAFLRALPKILHTLRTTPRILLQGHALPKDVILTVELPTQSRTPITET